jgi:murein DD-endopeptidase MepM/ murein hydrolase activator NlpD
MRIAVFLTVAMSFARAVGAQAPQVAIVPARPEPGALVRVTLTLGDAVARDSALVIRGTMAGEPLHFVGAAPGVWRAIGAVPVDASGRVVARVILDRPAAISDTLMAGVTMQALRAPTSRLRVDTTFTRPMDSATAARVARENARAREVGQRAHQTPRMWTEPFLRPRVSTITSRFGAGRLFNGRVTSRHLGVDFKGSVGDTVRAANRGVVALVDNFFLAGTLVYVDHGAGVVTGYFHLSDPLVAVGDTVKRGQPIGRVGQSGRVTGPHLHWAARYGALTVNPLDLVTLGAP